MHNLKITLHYELLDIRNYEVNTLSRYTRAYKKIEKVNTQQSFE